MAAFCAAKYEMKCAADLTGAACTGTAMSQAVGQPWVNITQTAALNACSSLGMGYQLITNQEWMTIARNIENMAANWNGGVVGTNALSSGHNDSAPANSLAASTDNDGCSGTAQTCSDVTWNSQRRTHKLSNGEIIWDFAGNVWDWSDWNVVTDKASPQNAYIEINTVAVPTATMTAVTFQSANNALTSAANGIGLYYPGLNSSGGAALRGGDWTSSANAGAFDLSLNPAPSYSAASIGFRCTRSQ